MSASYRTEVSVTTEMPNHSLERPSTGWALWLAVGANLRAPPAPAAQLEG